MSISAPRTYDDVSRSLRDRLGEAIEEISEGRAQLVARVPPERRPEALQNLKELGFTFYCFTGGVDWPEENRLEVLDNVFSPEHLQRAIVRCSVPRDNPRVPTASGVYAGANWHERETWEMLGIVFVGHPDLNRLYLSDWFEGFPLRKDYVLPSRTEKPWPGEFFEG